MASLPKPLHVSPLIKAARWSFLITGFIYGVNKKRILTAFEKKEKIKRAERLQRRQAESLVENKKQFIAFVLDLANQLSFDVPPGWEPPY